MKPRPPDQREAIVQLAHSEVVSYLEDQVRQIIWAEASDYIAAVFAHIDWDTIPVSGHGGTTQFLTPRMIRLNFHVDEQTARSMFRDIAKLETAALIEYLIGRRDTYMVASSHALAESVIAAREAAKDRPKIDNRFIVPVNCCGTDYHNWRAIINHRRSSTHQEPTVCCGDDYSDYTTLKEHIMSEHKQGAQQ